MYRESIKTDHIYIPSMLYDSHFSPKTHIHIDSMHFQKLLPVTTSAMSILGAKTICFLFFFWRFRSFETSLSNSLHTKCIFRSKFQQFTRKTFQPYSFHPHLGLLFVSHSLRPSVAADDSFRKCFFTVNTDFMYYISTRQLHSMRWNEQCVFFSLPFAILFQCHFTIVFLITSQRLAM